MSTTTPLINLKPTNPTHEAFAELQNFGLQPYDRSPNDYLRFVAKIFTAWRDPNDRILNFDPYDETYTIDGVTDVLQATSDKSIIAYIDGFQVDYYFTRLTTDNESTDLTSADNIIETSETITYSNEYGEIITINKAKYGEYHRFIVKAGICFIDNQLIQITEDTEWWFRIPDIKTGTNGDIYDADGNPTFELGQFIVDQTQVYSLLPNKRYRLILSYEYITQFETNNARIQFVTAETAIDQPYLLIATFTTNEFGMVHQNTPVNEENKEIYLNYIVKPDPDDTNKSIYYLRDIDNQYLDKKYMANHKNLFKHLQTQLLTVIADSKIANTFHVKEIKEEIDHSVSSGDFVYYNAVKNRWYPAVVSRQDFDRVHGLYLKNVSEGTNLLFTSGIIEVDDTYKIVNADNMILKNLIPGTEYFLVDDIALIEENAPFISPFAYTIIENQFTISTTVTAKASSITITMMNNPDAIISDFEISQTFVLDANLGEQRIEQDVLWTLSAEQKALIPKNSNGSYAIVSTETGLMATDKIQFKINLEMMLNELEETRQDVINAFEANDLELTLDYNTSDALGNVVTYPIKITSSDTDLQTMNLVPNLVGPKKPVSNLLAVLGVIATKDYNQFMRNASETIKTGDTFLDLTDTTTTMVEIRDPLNNVIESLDNKLNNSSPEDNGSVYGLNKKLALLGSELSKIDAKVIKLGEALEITENNYKMAKMEFQSTATALQEDITEKRNIYLGYNDTKNSYISQKEILTQKYNAVVVKLDELKTKRNSLLDTLATTTGDNIDLADLITDITSDISTLNAQLTTINNTITGFTTNITNLSNYITSGLSTMLTDTALLFDYRSNYYRVLNLTSPDYDLTDYSITPRLLNSISRIHELVIYKEAKELELDTLKTNYETSLDNYTTDVMNGVLTFAQQLIRLQQVKIDENLYSDKLNEITFANTELSSQTSVRDGLYPLFVLDRDSVKGELFAKIATNVDPASTWTDTNLVTFTARIDRVLSKDISFEFIYRQDTGDKAIIVIPAGQLTNSFSVYLNTFVNTIVDNGMPKWVATISGTTYANTKILNLNAYNEKLLNDYVATKLVIDTTQQHIYSLDTSKYNENPLNRKGTIKSISFLTTVFTNTSTLYTKQLERESNIIDKILEEDVKLLKENDILYHTNYLATLNTMLATGMSTVNSYQLEIDNLNNLINYYTTSTDKPVTPVIAGSDMSKDVIISYIALVNTNLTTIEPLVTNSRSNYNTSLNNLAVATDIALGQYVSTIEEITDTIKEKEIERESVNVLFELYDEKVNILNSIYANLNSISLSGIFNGEWTKISTLPLNSFEYQDGLENILVETIDYLSLLPYSSFDTAKQLEYVCTSNGIAYPTDLQSWIFAKSSGKISSRRYPGATSVGIALNNNTLILNIKHNHHGDISEFLNVYGNSADFINQLTAIYNIKDSISQKTSMIFATTNLNTKLTNLCIQLKNIPVATVRSVNGSNITITTNLNEIELDTIDSLTSTINNRELLLRLVFAKYFGSGTNFDSTSYLYEDHDSLSSYYHTIGNPLLNNQFDKLDPSTGVTFYNFTKSLLTNAGSSLDIETLKDLFYRKNSLYKDLDIIKYIVASLPEPLYNYQARFIELKANYTQLLLLNLQKERLIIFDNPGYYDAAGVFHDIIDDFENSAITNAADLVPTTAEIDEYNRLAEIKQQSIDDLSLSIETKKLSHDEVIDDVKRFVKYKNFYNNLLYDINNMIEVTIDTKNKYTDLKNLFTSKLLELDKTFLYYYKKSDKLPNTMWDIFRITNGQRTKWNYTYLVLRIKGMQQELNNIIVSNTIQYSPINAGLNELKIKKNAALTDGSETLAFVYQTEIDALLLKKNQFQSILDNYVEEFNTIQRAYDYQVISSEVSLQDSYIIPELYMQDPNEYNLSYEFSSYPAYTES